MKDFVVHIADPSGMDQRLSVRVEAEGDVGKAAQLAIDDMLSMVGRHFAFPLFIDIHPAEEFTQVATHYGAARV